MDNFKNIASFRRFPVDNRSAISKKFKTKFFKNFFVLWYRYFLCRTKIGHFRFDICIFCFEKCPEMSAFYETQMYCSPHHSKGHEKRDKFSGGNFFKFEPSYPQEIITSIVSKIQNFLCKSEHEKGKNYTFRFRDTSCVTNTKAPPVEGRP